MRPPIRLALCTCAAVLVCGTAWAEKPLRIVAFNVECLAAPGTKVNLERYRWEIARQAHAERVAAVIESLQPDIVNLEEVTSRASVEGLVKILHEKGMTGYRGYHVDGHDKFTEFDVALISKIVPDQVDGQQIQTVFSPYGERRWREPYSVTDERGQTDSRDTSISRNALYYITAGGVKLGFLGLHLKSNPEEAAANAQRVAESRVAQRIIHEKIVGRGYLPVVLGDLNDYDPDVADRDDSRRPVTDVIARLKDFDSSSAGPEMFNAAGRITRQQDRYTSHWDRNENGAADPGDVFTMIDHILLPQQLSRAVRRAFIDHSSDLDVSDHWPVVVDLDLELAVPAQTTAQTQQPRWIADTASRVAERNTAALRGPLHNARAVLPAAK